MGNKHGKVLNSLKLESFIEHIKEVKMTRENNEKSIKFVAKPTRLQKISNVSNMNIIISDSWNENKKKTDEDIKNLNCFKEIEVTSDNILINAFLISIFYKKSYKQRDVIEILKYILNSNQNKFEVIMKTEISKYAKRYIIDRHIHRVCVHAELKAIYRVDKKIQ
jgi:hypothetical protein